MFGSNAWLEAKTQGLTNRGQALAGIILGSIDVLIAIVLVATYASRHH